jgi:hypothetical protein
MLLCSSHEVKAAPHQSPGGHFEFVKINAKKFDWRDAYHTVLTLSWPAFAAFVFCVYFVLNCIFAGLYLLAPNSVAEVPPGHLPTLSSLASKRSRPLVTGIIIRSLSMGT